MKKTKKILAIAAFSTIGLSALTITSPQTVEAQTDFFGTLNRIESYANMTYDFQNPENMFLNDDYYLFYDGTNYLIKNAGSYMFYGEFNTPYKNAENNNKINNNSSQNQNNDEYYVLHNTSNNSNGFNNTNAQSSSSQTRTTNNTLSSPNNSQTNNSNSTYQSAKTNNNARRISLPNKTNNVGIEQDQTISSPPEENLINNSNNKTITNNEKQIQSNTYFDQSYEITKSISSINNSLTQNIQQLKQNMQNNQNVQTSNEITNYEKTLKRFANSLDRNQQELMFDLNKAYFNNNSQTPNNASNLCLKATLKSRIVILECCNEAITELNKLYSSSNSQTQKVPQMSNTNEPILANTPTTTQNNNNKETKTQPTQLQTPTRNETSAYYADLTPNPKTEPNTPKARAEFN